MGAEGLCPSACGLTPGYLGKEKTENTFLFLKISPPEASDPGPKRGVGG